jgi:excisionase family DNA binding protein
VENLIEENRHMIVELGPESLSALKRLAEAIEKLDPGVSDSRPEEEHPAPPNPRISCDDGQTSEAISLALAIARQAEVKQPQSPYLNAQEAAAYLRVSLKSIYAQVDRGNLKPGRGPRRRLLFKKDMLDRYVQRRGLRA